MRTVASTTSATTATTGSAATTILRRLALLPPLGAAALICAGGAMAEVPLGSDAFGGVLPFSPPAASDTGTAMPLPESVETFDPAARAQVLARDLPPFWAGTFQAFGSQQSLPVQLRLTAQRSIGQMVDLRGEMRIGEVVTPVQGNLNARSDQLDLLLLNRLSVAGLEPGGVFTGLQGLSLSGWQASRLTNPGGRLELTPVEGPQPAVPAQAPAAPVRGLW
ncbi:MAG: hypothetical protein MUD04_05360 [Cyanobium sp. Prado107]|nr:hypothetical protein [Cyanobium sp. Prado107]